MIKITHIEVSPFVTNCYLVTEEKTGQAALIDPGYDPNRIMRFIEEAGVEVRYLLATHGHLDHVSAAREMSNRLGLGLSACEDDRPVFESLPEACALYGMDPAPVPEIVYNLSGGEILELGDETLKIHRVPGHTPGSIAVQAGDDLIAGDVLFAGGIGRTDLPGGSLDTLRDSIMKTILPLGDEVRVHPGHGPATKIGWERTSNPFILDWAGDPA